MSTHNFPSHVIAVTNDISVEVSAMPTASPRLVINPALRVAEDGRVTFGDGQFCLTHTLTGRSLGTGYVSRLQDLAKRLAGFDWEFTDPQYFAKTDAGKKQAAVVLPIIRDWQMADAYDGPVHFGGDDEVMKQAREDAPALTLLREHIDWYMNHSKVRGGNDMYNKNRDAWIASIATECEGYGVIYLLAVLLRIDPKIADVAARDLVSAWEGGEFDEWVWQWDGELTSDRPVTLHGIPDADPLANFR